MDNFRDSYFQVDWDLTTKRLKGTYWGKQYDTGRGFAVTVINGGQVVTPTTEVLRLKWEKPDNTSGYVNATIVNGKFVIENIDQMFTVQGSVRADFELSVAGEFVASITFYVSVEKAVAVDAVASSSQFTALQDALADVGDMQAQVDAVIANATVDSEVILARGTEPTLGARLDATDVQLNETDQRIDNILEASSNLFNKDKAISGVLSSTTGELAESTKYFSTEFIPAKANTPYTRYRFNRVLYYDKNKSFIGTHSNSETNTQITNTTPNGTKFIRLSVENDVLLQDAQVTEGEEITVFEPYYNKLAGVSFDVNVEDVTFIEKSSNLFNMNKEVKNTVLSSSDGTLAHSDNYHTSDWIEINPGQSFVFYGFTFYATYDQNKNFVGRNAVTHDATTSITIGSGVHYVRFSRDRRFEESNQARLNKGNTLFPYEPYYVRFNDSITQVSETQKKITLPLESSGLDFNTGKITPSITENWTTTKRTGRFLNVIPSTSIKFDFDVGKGYVFEYDVNFNFIRSSEVNGELTLLPTTTYLKFMVGELVNGQYVNAELTYMSKEGKTTWVYNNRVSPDTFSFIYEVDANQGREVLVNDDFSTEQYTNERYYNKALLKLPPNYDPFGKPVKLIIANGGAGSHTTFAQSDFSSPYPPYFQYLVDEGYAVLDLYKWTTKYMVEPNTNFGSPTSISAIVQGYKWVTKNFNVSDTGVFVWGYSAGGYPSSILDRSKGLPVLATGMFAPSISPLTRPYGYDAQSRLAYADDFGFEGDVSGILDHPGDGTSKTEIVKEFMRLNAPKIIGYNGFWNGIVGTDLETLITHAVNNEEGVMANYQNVYRIKNTPTKIWVSEDDTAVSADICKTYLQTIKNGHGVGELRLMPDGTGGHYSVTNDPNALKVDSITTKLGVTHTDVPLAFVELVQFYRRYEN